jgi:hypothetical protein
MSDHWCTPRWLTDALPVVDLDPCSNDRSSVRSKDRCTAGGLERSWSGLSVFVNPPYSNVLPWARKAPEAEAWIFLVNHDHSTRWWRELQSSGGHYQFQFHQRIAFDPPPGVEASSNSKPQVLVCNYAGYRLIGSVLDKRGRWWVAI